MRTAEGFLPGGEGVELLPLRVASIARDPAQHPGRRPWIAVALEHREPLRKGNPELMTASTRSMRHTPESPAANVTSSGGAMKTVSQQANPLSSLSLLGLQ